MKQCLKINNNLVWFVFFDKHNKEIETTVHANASRYFGDAEGGEGGEEGAAERGEGGGSVRIERRES